MQSRRKTDVVVTRKGAITATVFGTFTLTDNQGHSITVANRRAKTVLAMLCVAPDKVLGREYLSQLLWPGRFEAQAKASLRQCLLDLGKILNPIDSTILNVTRTEISLKKELVTTDLSNFKNFCARKDYVQATALLVNLGTSQLLEQMHYGEHFNDWLNTQRLQSEQKLSAAVVDGLNRLMQSNEPILHSHLLNAWKVRNPDFSLPTLLSQNAKRIRIAVLPFESLQEKHDYFSDGIVDEIITMLGQLPELLVAGRNSSFGLKNSEFPLPEIAKILGVEHIVEGSVQRQGNDVRINIRLMNGATGFETWGNRYKGTVDDIFALQESVASAVTRELSPALNILLSTPQNTQVTRSHEAYDLFMQGKAFTKRMMSDGALSAAVKCLEKAIDLDPDFSESWSALAEVHAYTILMHPNLDVAELSKRMAECAEKAAELSPKNGYALVMLGVYKWMQNDPLGALDLAFRAYELEPNNPSVIARLGSFLSYCGLTKQAFPYIAAAVEQDPLDGRHLLHLSSALFNLGDFEKAQHIGQKIVAVGFPSLWLAVATAATGDNALAVKQYAQSQLMTNSLKSLFSGEKKMTEQELDLYWETASRGICSGKLEDREKYCRLLDYMYATLPDKNDHKLALPAVWMGYAPMVFKTFGEQINPANMAGLIAIWADIEPINQVRSHPDFIQFAERIGLVKVWQKYGWPDLLPEPSSG
jgi:TolB-like protein/tetratricopeptide (TPR) repeat protein/DNA-binding winged helix-turn-helix (wHTH) protein